jgi:hypothetical protein
VAGVCAEGEEGHNLKYNSSFYHFVSTVTSDQRIWTMTELLFFFWGILLHELVNQFCYCFSPNNLQHTFQHLTCCDLNVTKVLFTFFVTLLNSVLDIVQQKIESGSECLGTFRDLKSNCGSPDGVQEDHHSKLELFYEYNFL